MNCRISLPAKGRPLFGPGLSGFALKVIATVFMTIDHLSVFADQYETFYFLSVLGRIAAPIFLFLITESLHHTRNKIRFVFQLYLYSVVIEAASYLLHSKRYIGSGDMNIIRDFFWVALYCFLLEQLIMGIRGKDTRAVFFNLLLLAATLIPVWASIVRQKYWGIWPSSIHSAIMALLPSPLDTMYSPVFLVITISPLNFHHLPRGVIGCY